MDHFRLSWGTIVAVGLTIVASGASAQVTTQGPASVLVLPKIIADGTWDTTIQIANGANRPTHAVCHYVSGNPTFPDQPPGPTNPPVWASIHFAIDLARLQPTYWNAARGRAEASETPCAPTSVDCDAAGLKIGVVPSLPAGFIGELVCIEVDASGAPWTGNGLLGQATLIHTATGEVVKYPAIGLTGFGTNNADGTLCLGGDSSENCASGAEYSACPDEWIVSHHSDFDDTPVDGERSRTTLTIVPCTVNLDTQVPTSVILNMMVINELEQAFSTARSVQCWANLELGDLDQVFRRDVVGDWLETRVRVAAASGGGVAVVQQTERDSAWPPAFAAVATTPHQHGSGTAHDLIVLPAEEIQ